MKNFHTIQAALAFETPEAFLDSIRHYDKEIRAKKLNMAYEVCTAMDSYQTLIPTGENFPSLTEGSESQLFTPNATNIHLPAQISEHDKIEESERAETYKLYSPWMKNPYIDFQGNNRGGYTLIVTGKQLTL